LQRVSLRDHLIRNPNLRDEIENEAHLVRVQAYPHPSDERAAQGQDILDVAGLHSPEIHDHASWVCQIEDTVLIQPTIRNDEEVYLLLNLPTPEW
jgi:hypothetical protein